MAQKTITIPIDVHYEIRGADIMDPTTRIAVTYAGREKVAQPTQGPTAEATLELSLKRLAVEILADIRRGS